MSAGQDPNDRPETVILIAGPTASGKSALALALACRLGATVINADSMQIYRDLRILTARPSPEDEALCPHRLYGVVDGAERCSAGRFANLAAQALRACARDGMPAIVTGGTGLYFRVLTDGLSPIPALAPADEAAARAALDRLGPDGLHAKLDRRDPDSAARIRPSDTQRLLRAWALLESSGIGLAAWQQRPGTPILPDPTHRLVLEAPRDWLWARAEARFDAMLESGAMEEVRTLLLRELPPDLPVMKAVGVREIADQIAGTATRLETLARGQTATRRYIKRQLTWFRHQMADWRRVPATTPPHDLVTMVKNLVQPD